MSTGTPRNYTSTDTAQPGTATLTLVLGYLMPFAAVIGLFVLIAIGKLDSSVGIPLIATIVGVHGGAAISSNTPTN